MVDIQPSTKEISPAKTDRRPTFSDRVSRLVARPTFWVAAIAVLFGWPIARSLSVQLPGPLPVLGTLPDFQLTDHQGRAFGGPQLRGRVWVANFIFTRCPEICPRLTRQMAKVQHRSRNIAQAFRLVSFSVDPENDTPEVLAAYAKEHRASSGRWFFLTGKLHQIREVVVKGLKIAMGGNASDPASIFHGNQIVLVDRKMQIRGYYKAEDNAELDRLLRDAGLILARN